MGSNSYILNSFACGYWSRFVSPLSHLITALYDLVVMSRIACILVQLPVTTSEWEAFPWRQLVFYGDPCETITHSGLLFLVLVRISCIIINPLDYFIYYIVFRVLVGPWGHSVVGGVSPHPILLHVWSLILYACHCFLRYCPAGDFHSGGFIVCLFHFVLVSASFARLPHEPRGFRGEEDHRAGGERGLPRDAGVVPDVQSHELVHLEVESFRQRGQRELELLINL